MVKITLLIFAKEESFDINYLISQLQGKECLEILQFNAKHGFMDSFSQNYNEQQSKYAEDYIYQFFSEHRL